MRPLIAVTATMRRENPQDPSRLRLNAAYCDAVARAGGTPLVTPPMGLEALEPVLGAARGILLTGGEDINPETYGAAAHTGLGRVTDVRDAWELALVRGAKARGIPVLGVCRGIQVLNVALGGTLIQHIPSDRPAALPHDQTGKRSRRTHALACAPGSRLAAIMGERCEVNSMHHQAVDRVATGLTVTATAPDCIVEGVEWTASPWWALGVQWHPEELDGADPLLFAALVAAARG